MHSLETKSCVPLLELPPWSAERYTVASKMSMTMTMTNNLFHKTYKCNRIE